MLVGVHLACLIITNQLSGKTNKTIAIVFEAIKSL